MTNNSYLKRLREDLPSWAERGWVKPGDERAILDHVEGEKGGGTRFLTLAFAMLGVLLLGSGIITFFAANWQVMAKLTKLIILFCSMGLAYGLAGYFETKESPRLAQAMLLLGVILFGSNIMLIAQIYHIDAHYPNGVLLWALGGLLAAYVLKSQAALLAAIPLAVLWTGMETFGFDRQFHWPFLILWTLFLPPIYQGKWKASLHLAMTALLFWSFFVFGEASERQNELYLIQVFFLAYLAFFILGRAMATYSTLALLSGTVRSYTAFASLLCLYALTFPGLHRGRYAWITNEPLRAVASTKWQILTAAALLLVLVATWWNERRASRTGRPAYLTWGYGVIALVITLVLINLFLPGRYGSSMAVFFNLAFFGGIIWLIYAGVHANDRSLVNLSFLFFTLGLFSRYFDTFWTLLNRSYFFMAGGLLLIGGGYFLERQRRILTGRIVKQPAEGRPR
jgi:uncharacterized membrane protein